MYLKASSLSNAIFVCLMISIFSGCLVLISYYQNLLNSKLEFEETLINTNLATFDYYTQNPELLEFDKFTTIDLLGNDILSYVTKKKWGFYDILSCKTPFKGDTISKTALIGYVNTEKNLPTLFVTNYDKSLKLSGNSKIIGISKVPNGSLEEAYINGQTGNTIEIRGQQLVSEYKLPTINTRVDIPLNDNRMTSLGTFKSSTIFNSFASETIIINISDLSRLQNIEIKGNIILYSNTNITISSTAKLNDVLLLAKSVIIENEFSGNLQIIAKNKVKLKTNAHLKYPSSIYIKTDELQSANVHLEPYSKIAGGIIIDGDQLRNAKKRTLIIDKSSTVYGTAYCYGSTQLQGDVIGQLYTDRFFLKTQSSEYENIILNGSIHGDSLPKQFVKLPIFNSSQNSKTYEIIKEF